MSVVTEGDFFDLARFVLALVKEHQLDAAAREVEAARARFARVDVQARSETLSAATSALFTAKRQIEAIRREIEKLPEDVRLDAEFRLLPVLDSFEADITRLRSTRRQLGGHGETR